MMEVAVPFPHEAGGPESDRVVWCPANPRNPGARDHATLCTKLPTWNRKLKTMVLDFAGRVKKASARNLQMCYKGEEGKGKDAKVILQYGKWKKGEYALDYQYPLSAVQALGIALTARTWS